jgi:transaldolase
MPSRGECARDDQSGLWFRAYKARAGTVVVADTGDFTLMQAFKPQDATTNPTLMYESSIVRDVKLLQLTAAA